MDMLQERGSYDCSVQQTQQQDFTECTVLLRRRTTSDQLIEKQALLLQKVRHDNQLLKRFLERKTMEMAKLRLCIEALQSDNQQLRGELEGLSAKRGEHGQLHHENQLLRQRVAQLQAERLKVEDQHQSQLLALRQEVQNLSNENEFLQKMNKQNEYLQTVEIRCRELELQLERERRGSEPQRRVIEFIKIDGEPEYEQTDQVKNSLELAPKRGNECGLSAVRSGNSEPHFEDCEPSYESEGSKGKSLSYNKSEAEIQTQRCEIYGSGVLSRQKIERSIRRDNHHMKPMDEYARIMNLSKELNEKEQTIKELEKRVERERMNSESVKSKLKERERELKQIKKNRSLRREAAEEEERRDRREEERREPAGEPEAEERAEAKNVVIIEEAREMNEVNVQTENKEDCELLRQEIESLRAENAALKARGQAKQEEEYEAQGLRISIAHQHDSQSEAEDETAALRAEIGALKAKVRQLEEQRVEIPFEEVQEEKALNEVVVQTEEKPPAEGGDQPNDLMKYLIGFTGNSTGVDGPELQENVIIEEKQLAEVNIQTEQQDKPEHQEQKSIDAEPDPQLQIKELKPVRVHQVRQQNYSGENEVLIGRRDWYNEREEERQEKQKLEQQLQSIRKEIQMLTAQKQALKAEGKCQAKQEEEYEEENLRISVTAQYDSQSEEEADEATVLRAEVQQLKARIRDLQQMREEIPFEETEEVKELREVVVQTQPEEKQTDPSDHFMGYIQGISLQPQLQSSQPIASNQLQSSTQQLLVTETLDQIYDKVITETSPPHRSQQSAHLILPVQPPATKDSHDDEVRRLREDNQALQEQIARMRELLQLQEAQQRAKQSKQEEYVEEGLRISVNEQHDSQSEGEDEFAVLKTELQALRAKVRELEEQREEIPFEEVQEVKTLKEVEMQAEERTGDQEQQAVSESAGGKEEEPVIVMKELKRVQVHHDHRHKQSEEEPVLIGRRDQHRQREEELKQGDCTTAARKEEYTINLEEQLEEIKREIESLRAENLALRTATARAEAKQEEEYEEENLRISVTAQYDSQSEEEADEATVLRAEVQELKARIRDLQQMREEIPFQQMEQAKELREVVVQTQPEEKQTDPSDHFMGYIQGLSLDNPPKQQQQQQLLLLEDTQGYSFVPQPKPSLPKTAKLSIQQPIQLHIPRQIQTSSIIIPSAQQRAVHSYVQQPVTHQATNLTDSNQTPKFQASSRSLYNSSDNLRFLEALARPKEHSQGLREQLALKNEQIFALNEKLAWLQQKICKYRRLLGKYRQKSEQILEQIQVQEQQLLLIEVQTQTNPLFITDLKDSLQRRCEVLQSRLEEEQRANFALRSKLKRWQNVMKRINYSNVSEESIEDLEELEIQEENIQLCEVEVQVGGDLAKSEGIGMREKIKQTNRMLQDLRQKVVGDDSQENSSEGCSDRGRKTKRSVGSEEQNKCAKERQSKGVDIGLKVLYIEHESVVTKPRAAVELNPLLITEVKYYSLSGTAETREA